MMRTATGRDRPPGSPVSPDAAAPSGPLARIVLASLAAGGIGALVLILFVFPGAREHTTTGVALIAFGAGWALLDLLTTRYTTQPQRWARVPALAMTATGVALLLLAPGNAGLTAAGWVWPPALLALTVWMGLQLRRTMSSRARWLVYPVLALMGLASAGGLAETVALARDARTGAAPGKLYDVGRYRLHLTCAGTGSPTVVLTSGTGGTSADWARVLRQVAATSRVCAYDRVGQGWSEDPPRGQDGQDSRAVATDLHALLAAAGERGPFLLAGHSIGGVYSMTYAAQYPGDVAGMVLLDSSSPEQFSILPDYPSQYAMIRRLYGVTPSLARLGMTRPFGGSPSLTSRGLENARDESSRYADSFRQAQALRTLGSKPLVVLSAAQTMAHTAGWPAAQAKLAALSTNSLRYVAETTHAGMVSEPLGAAASAHAILRALDAVRTGAQVTSD